MILETLRANNVNVKDLDLEPWNLMKQETLDPSDFLTDQDCREIKEWIESIGPELVMAKISLAAMAKIIDPGIIEE